MSLKVCHKQSPVQLPREFNLSLLLPYLEGDNLEGHNWGLRQELELEVLKQEKELEVLRQAANCLAVFLAVGPPLAGFSRSPPSTLVQYSVIVFSAS